MKILHGLVLFVALLMHTTWASATETISFVVYNSYVPIILDTQPASGFAYAVADLLTKRSQGRFHFVVQVVPRKRLDHMLESGDPLVVPFVAPSFFADEAMTRYFWTSPLFVDRQLIVYNPAHPIDYKLPDSLRGKILGGIIGFHYAPLEAMIAKGEITREDAVKDEQNLAKLAAARIDAVTISSLSYNYLRTVDLRFGELETCPTPLYPIERRFFVQGRADIRDFIESALADVATSPEWHNVFSSVHLR